MAGVRAGAGRGLGPRRADRRLPRPATVLTRDGAMAAGHRRHRPADGVGGCAEERPTAGRSTPRGHTAVDERLPTGVQGPEIGTSPRRSGHPAHRGAPRPAHARHRYEFREIAGRCRGAKRAGASRELSGGSPSLHLDGVGLDSPVRRVGHPLLELPAPARRPPPTASARQCRFTADRGTVRHPRRPSGCSLGGSSSRTVRPSSNTGCPQASSSIVRRARASSVSAQPLCGDVALCNDIGGTYMLSGVRCHQAWSLRSSAHVVKRYW
jgi:hypothetical protein